MAVRKSSPKGKQTSLRHLWLASLGAVVVARREARDTVAGAVDEVLRLRGRAIGIVGDAAAIARGGMATVRGQVEPVIERVATRVGQGLAPVLERVGRAPKKPAARKPQARRAARKPAAKKKATPRPMSARKQAERRVASKGR
ncbi:hypothetical protein ACTJIL_06065 [Luteimonas sp. 22616]|uniref:hypothetical protein n=1 Tax=Luteimonas sp. 22616 TaxID=3453951 RepID=UPI003F842991